MELFYTRKIVHYWRGQPANKLTYFFNMFKKIFIFKVSQKELLKLLYTT